MKVGEELRIPRELLWAMQVQPEERNYLSSKSKNHSCPVSQSAASPYSGQGRLLQVGWLLACTQSSNSPGLLSVFSNWNGLRGINVGVYKTGLERGQIFWLEGTI